jgi:hypothetical protein
MKTKEQNAAVRAKQRATAMKKKKIAKTISNKKKTNNLTSALKSMMGDGRPQRVRKPTDAGSQYRQKVENNAVSKAYRENLKKKAKKLEKEMNNLVAALAKF